MPASPSSDKSLVSSRGWTPVKVSAVSVPKLVGLAIALAIAFAYTVAAFGMDMQTTNGSIGPGFFPRIIGLLLVATLVIAIGKEFVSGRVDQGARPEKADLIALAIFFAAVVGFAILYVTVSWVVSAIVFLVAMLSWLNRGNHVLNLCVGIGVPVVLYLALDLGLGAQFPQ